MSGDGGYHVHELEHAFPGIEHAFPGIAGLHRKFWAYFSPRPNLNAGMQSPSCIELDMLLV